MPDRKTARDLDPAVPADADLGHDFALATDEGNDIVHQRRVHGAHALLNLSQFKPPLVVHPRAATATRRTLPDFIVFMGKKPDPLRRRNSKQQIFELCDSLQNVPGVLHEACGQYRGNLYRTGEPSILADADHHILKVI
jgi:hypothetical protein